MSKNATVRLRTRSAKAPATNEVLVLPLTQASYRRARRHIRENCGHLAELAVGEVLANAIEHGRKAQLCLSVRPRRVVVVVSNDIGDYHRKQHKTHGLGGRGLAIVQKLAAAGAVRRYDCTIQGTKHSTRLVLSRSLSDGNDQLLIPGLDLEFEELAEAHLWLADTPPAADADAAAAQNNSTLVGAPGARS